MKNKNRYNLKVLKPHRKEVREKHPNLAKSPRQIIVHKFKSTVPLWKLSDKKKKKVAKKQLQANWNTFRFDKHSLDKKEKFVLESQVPKEQRDFENPLWKGKLKVPKQKRVKAKQGGSRNPV